MGKFTIQSYCYNEAALALRKKIAEFLNSVWPDTNSQASDQTETPVSHRAELSARSFCCCADDILVGYAAIVHKQIFHCGHNFKIAGLSCVATHPNYRGCGIGSKVVSAATQYLASQNDIDVGIFTCHPDLAAFYKKAGDWEISPDVKLIGSHDEGALSSKALNVVVLMRLFSEKAQANKALFRKEPISLDFPIGEFI